MRLETSDNALPGIATPSSSALPEDGRPPSRYKMSSAPTDEKKRRRSWSPDSPRKRRSLSPRAPDAKEGHDPLKGQPRDPSAPSLPNTAQDAVARNSLNDSRCPVCGLTCWNCYSALKVAQPPPDDMQEPAQDGKAQGQEQEQEQEQEQGPDLMQPPTAPPSAFVPPSLSASETTESSGSFKKRKREKGDTRPNITPRDENFCEEILEPCGLFLDLVTGSNVTPVDLFGEESKRVESRVFLDIPNELLPPIMQDFEAFKAHRYDECALMSVCFDKVVLRDQFILDNAYDSSTRRLSVRREKWKPPQMGPEITNIQYRYNWELEPDTTYGVSVNMFEYEARKLFKKQELRKQNTKVGDVSLVAPYFTIEYKCTDKTGKAFHAQCQLATASIIWLCQRKAMRDALQKAVYNDLKHYSLAIVDDNYTFYEMRFDEKLRYKMRKVKGGVLTDVEGLRTYIQWSNAIHRWGLGANADAYQKDVLESLDLGKQAA